MSVGMLGDSAKKQWGQITVHAGGLHESVLSYTALVRSDILMYLKLVRGDLVTITLEARKIGPSKYIWVAKEPSFIVH